VNTGELIEMFGRDTGDTELPYLWSEEERLAYANDAYSMFVRLTGGIPDFTSEAAEVAIAAGEPLAEIHPSVMRIMSAKRRSDGREIEIINATDLARLQASDYGALKPLLMSTERGAVTKLVIGMQRNKGRWIFTPDDDDVADLHIYRMPLAPLTSEGQELSEIEPMHHIHLLKWMKALAYRKQDAETFDRTRAEDSEALFRIYCDQVVGENERYKHKTRVVAYGGL